MQQQGFSLDIVKFAAGNGGQTNQRIRILGLGRTRLLKRFARGGKVFAFKGLVTLTEQHQVMTSIHQVLPLTDVRSVLLFVARRNKRGVGFFIAALTQQGQTQCAIQAWVIGVMFDRAAQQPLSHHGSA